MEESITKPAELDNALSYLGDAVNSLKSLMRELGLEVKPVETEPTVKSEISFADVYSKAPDRIAIARDDLFELVSILKNTLL